jgi:hypothetical protein
MEREKLNHIRQTLTEACEKHLSKGGHIVSGQFGNEEYHCPIGALVGNVDSKVFVANDLLGLKHESIELWEFIYAFDGADAHVKSDLGALGLEFRHKYLTKK